MKTLNFIFMIIPLLYCLHGSAVGNHTQKNDEYYMQLAINLATHNTKSPFAALVVDNITGKIIAQGVNADTTNPTFHGEIVAINNCIKKYPNIDWSKVTLYTTGEPCPMCQGAIIWAGISRVVFATSIEYLKRHGWDQINITASELNNKATFYKGTLTGGVLAEKTNILFNK